MCSAPSAPQSAPPQGGVRGIMRQVGMKPAGRDGSVSDNASSSSSASRTGTSVVGGGAAGGEYSTILGGMDDQRSASSKKTLLGQ